MLSARLETTTYLLSSGSLLIFSSLRSVPRMQRVTFIHRHGMRMPFTLVKKCRHINGVQRHKFLVHDVQVAVVLLLAQKARSLCWCHQNYYLQGLKHADRVGPVMLSELFKQLKIKLFAL